MADPTPEGPNRQDPPVSRREMRRREGEGEPDTPPSDTPSSPEPPLGEDHRTYPELDASVTVRPAAREGYQTVLVNRSDSPQSQAKREARRRRRRRRNIVLVSAFAAFVVLVAGLALAFKGLLPSPAAEDYPGPGTGDVTFTVNQGEGALAIGQRLEEQDIVASSRAFIEAVNQSRSENSIQAGDYALKNQMKAAEVASILLREGQGQVHYVAINRGMRLNEALSAVSEATGWTTEELEEVVADPEEFGLPAEAPSLEGYLAPGEYRFPVDAEPADVFAQMIEPTFAELEEQGITDEQEQFRTVTIASILEAEALTDDYPIVAGIIENRLHPDNPETGGYLQIDATVIYGLGQRQLQFTEEQKRDASNEYNTYEHRGLPPGPIGAPSTQAIDAAAHPEENDFYYWVTTNIETGETKFAKDYAQHQVYQQEYRDYCAENEEICG